jgi:sugar transferase (PEP-CTERM system associated)
MTLLRHYVSLPTALLALFEFVLFLGALFLFGVAGHCDACYFTGIGHLNFFQAILVALTYVLISSAIGLYNRDALLDFRVFLARFFVATQLLLLPTVLIVGVIKATTNQPFGWYIGVLSLAIGAYFSVVLIVRIIVFWTVDHPFLKRRILVIGEGAPAQAVKAFIRSDGSAHLRCVGHTSRTGAGTQASPLVIGNLALRLHPDAQRIPLPQLAEAVRAEEIVVATTDRRGLPFDELLECKLRGIQVVDYVRFWEREAGYIDVERIGAGTLTFEDGFRVNFSRRSVKRAFDIVVSLVFLLLVSPICALVALLIKLDSPGPALFRQERVGLNGQVFRIWKFRSMRIDAEADGVARWASERDPRITRVGHFIRKTRIDEFPQVVNVLLGDMSFIGPRPERPVFVEQLRKEIPYYDIRHRVQPGITGWAQVSYRYGASREDAKKKLCFDLYYVKNNDTVLDLAILLQTVRVILFAHGGR